MNLSCPQRTMNDNRKQYSMRRMNHKSWTMAYQYFNGVPRACIHCIPAHLRIGFKVYAGDLFQKICVCMTETLLHGDTQPINKYFRYLYRLTTNKIQNDRTKRMNERI